MGFQNPYDQDMHTAGGIALALFIAFIFGLGVLLGWAIWG